MHSAQLIVGDAASPGSSLTARSCHELAVLLENDCTVDSVVTPGILPDGDYVDVVRLVAARSQTAEVLVLGRDGSPVFRFKVQGGAQSFERLTDPEFSLCYQNEAPRTPALIPAARLDARFARSWRASCRSAPDSLASV
jgi:hypothetical protein